MMSGDLSNGSPDDSLSKRPDLKAETRSFLRRYNKKCAAFKRSEVKTQVLSQSVEPNVMDLLDLSEDESYMQCSNTDGTQRVNV